MWCLQYHAIDGILVCVELIVYDFAITYNACGIEILLLEELLLLGAGRGYLHRRRFVMAGV